jgi:hypothetical protein
LLTKKHAEEIATKLGAEIRHRKAHDLAVVFYEGKLIAAFGIRRGSRANAGHDHSPNDLHVSPRTCLGLAECPVSRDDWIEQMKQKGLIQ